MRKPYVPQFRLQFLLAKVEDWASKYAYDDDKTVGAGPLRGLTQEFVATIAEAHEQGIRVDLRLAVRPTAQLAHLQAAWTAFATSPAPAISAMSTGPLLPDVHLPADEVDVTP